MAAQVPEFITPLVNKILEILEVLVEGTLIVPPINALPANPKPPLTTKAPEFVDVEAVL